MSVRPPAWWWLTYTVAVLAWLAAAGVVWGLFANGVAKTAAVLLLTPGAWLVGAVLLGRGAGPRLAAGTAVVAGVLLVANLAMLRHVVGPRVGWPLPVSSGRMVDLLGLGQFPFALAALSANAFGRWRRQDRLATPDSAA